MHRPTRGSSLTHSAQRREKKQYIAGVEELLKDRAGCATYLAKTGVVAQLNHGAAGVVRRQGDVRDDHCSNQASRVGCRKKEGGSGSACTNSTPYSEYGGRQVEKSCSRECHTCGSSPDLTGVEERQRGGQVLRHAGTAGTVPELQPQPSMQGVRTKTNA